MHHHDASWHPACDGSPSAPHHEINASMWASGVFKLSVCQVCNAAFVMLRSMGDKLPTELGSHELTEDGASAQQHIALQHKQSDDSLHRFGVRLAQLIAPTLPIPAVHSAIQQTILGTRVGQPGEVFTAAKGTEDGRRLELVFVHECRNHGCNRAQCVLCKHNPNKRCVGNFAHKYWVGDRLLAKCDGEIQVELVDADSGERVTEDLTAARVELCILDGNKYNTRCREAGEQRLEILDECEVLRNQKSEPLLLAASANNDAKAPQVVLKFQAMLACVPLKDVKVTESSESVLAGTKRPPFRLVVRTIRSNGRRLNIRPAVSEEFVVVTKRTKNLKKQDIPSLDDPISKLNHIGKETVKKLNELKISADEALLDLNLPIDLFRIMKVQEFQRLARASEADGHMQQKLKQLLKLSKEKWDAACDHAKTAVQVDNRMRAWYTKSMEIGLLYTCRLGDVRPDCPVALIQNRNLDGHAYLEVIPTEHQLPSQREQVDGTCEQAIRCWWEDRHPGWMIFTLGNQHFDTLDQIIQYSQQSVSQLGALPSPTSSGEENAATPGTMLQQHRDLLVKHHTGEVCGAPPVICEVNADVAEQPADCMHQGYETADASLRVSGPQNPFEFVSTMPFIVREVSSDCPPLAQSPNNMGAMSHTLFGLLPSGLSLNSFPMVDTGSRLPLSLFPMISANSLLKMSSLTSLGGSLGPFLNTLSLPSLSVHEHGAEQDGTCHIPQSLAEPATKRRRTMESQLQHVDN